MEALIALLALTSMEIVLGIDNIIFIAILTSRLPSEQQPRARTLGLAAALVTRLLLLFSLTWILGSTAPLFELTDLGVPQALISFAAEQPPHGSEADRIHAPLQSAESAFEVVNAISWRDLILFFGGLFLVGKSVHEIHHKIEGSAEADRHASPPSFGSVIFQIAIIDIVFSLDSVITAVGMVPADMLWVMATAVVIAVIVMLISAGRVSQFIERHPTIKILALSFLILIGVMLVAEGLGAHVNKGYIYFAMAFAVVVEMLNIRLRTRSVLEAVTDLAS